MIYGMKTLIYDSYLKKNKIPPIVPFFHDTKSVFKQWQLVYFRIVFYGVWRQSFYFSIMTQSA